MMIGFSVILLPFPLLNSRGWPLGVLYSRTRRGYGGVVSLIVTSKEDRISIQNSVSGKVGSAIAYVDYLVRNTLTSSL